MPNFPEKMVVLVEEKCRKEVTMKDFDIIYGEITAEWLKSNPIKRIVDKFERTTNRTLVLYGGSSCKGL